MKIIITMLLLLFLLTGCTEGLSDNDTEPSSNSMATLTLATMPALETFPIFIAADLGFFEDEGLDVELEQFFSPRDRDIAFQTNEYIDGMTFDLVQLAIYREAGIDLVATTSTIGMASLIGAEDVHIIEDLLGRNVLMTSNTSMDYILDRALSSANMAIDDIYTDEVPALPTRLEMLLHGQAAGAILPDPFAAMALEEGLTELITIRELGINPFVIVFRMETTTDKLEELQAFYRAINRAVEFLNNADRDEFIDTLIETVGYPPHIRDTLIIPVFPAYEAPLAGIVQDVLDFAYSRGLLTLDISVEDIIFDIGN